MGLEENVFIGNSLVRFYEECRDLDRAWQCLMKCLRETLCRGLSLICGYGRRNMPKDPV
ncbi:hypothetical protein RchiOBHm_Chr4g0388061 [Rosa chinensis]|uniref:Uncharacterized protein n=1 Tax=Rosa chinensis TaxID=74649 RepID=A0A2P6QPM5_ROSCH|nr:hypothetical protein RchiOBHm_Chr4g0388061 [Rosa chinensis]